MQTRNDTRVKESLTCISLLGCLMAAGMDEVEVADTKPRLHTHTHTYICQATDNVKVLVVLLKTCVFVYTSQLSNYSVQTGHPLVDAAITRYVHLDCI